MRAKRSRAARAYAASSSDGRSTPRPSASMRSQSPIPAVETTGSPAARYSPTLVGEDDRFEKHGLMKDRPASAAASAAGTSAGGRRRTANASAGTPEAASAPTSASAGLGVITSRNKRGSCARAVAKKRAISA